MVYRHAELIEMLGWRDVLQGGAGIAAIVAGAPRGARALQQERVAARVRANVAESRAAREASGFGGLVAAEARTPPPAVAPPGGVTVARGRGMTAAEANAPHVAAGRQPPYAEGTRARDVVLQQDRVFARVHGDDNQARSWMMRPEEIEGLSPAQIRDKFALPDQPTYVSDVHVPAGTRVRVGTVAAQEGWGRGGAIQYELQERLPVDAFRNRRPLAR